MLQAYLGEAAFDTGIQCYLVGVKNRPSLHLPRIRLVHFYRMCQPFRLKTTTAGRASISPGICMYAIFLDGALAANSPVKPSLWRSESKLLTAARLD
jgi:hypothetical protein